MRTIKKIWTGIKIRFWLSRAVLAGAPIAQDIPVDRIRRRA